MSTDVQLLHLEEEEELLLDLDEEKEGNNETPDNEENNKGEKPVLTLVEDESEENTEDLAEQKEIENRTDTEKEVEQENPVTFTDTISKTTSTSEKPQENPISFTDTATSNPYSTPEKLQGVQEATTEDLTSKPSFNIMDTLLNKMITESLTDDDFLTLCKIQKIEGKDIVTDSIESGLTKDIILYGRVMKTMGKPKERMQGVYSYKTTNNIAEDLKNRLAISSPQLSTNEYESMCSFLGYTKEDIEKLSTKLWLSREDILRGVLNKRMVGV